MTVEVREGQLRVSVGYSLKVPHEVAYATEDAHVGFSLEIPIDPEEKVSELVKQGLAIQADLHTNAKMAVFAQLGVEFDTTTGGVLQPIVPEREKKTKAAAAKPQWNGVGPGGTAPQKRNNYGPPKADASALPVVVLNGRAYRDQRPLKEDGTYAPGAADFKSVDQQNGRFDQLWLYSKDGQLNDGVAEMLAAAGVGF